MATDPAASVPWRGAAALGVAAGTLLGLLGQLVKPFHLLTHEFTQVFSVLGAGVVLWWSWRAGRDHAQRARAVLLVAVAQALVLGGAAFGLQIAANALVHGCRVTDASFFFWVTWIPISLAAAVAGTLVGEAGWGSRRLGAVVAGSLVAVWVHDALQAMAGVRLSDPLIGDVLLIDQRLDMTVPLSHVYQRSWLVAVAATAWWAWRARVDRDATSAAAAALLGVPLALVTGLAGSHLGVGWGTGAIRTHLDATATTDHFVIRYRSAGRSSLYVDAIGRAAEWHWHALTESWGITPRAKVEIRVYDQTNAMQALTGIGNPHAGLYRIDLTWNRALSSTLHHELVHALHVELSRQPLLVLLRGHLEGAAEAWADDLVAVPEAHRRQAGALRAGKLPAATDFMGPLGFFMVNEGNAYVAASSFMGWLVLEHGVGKFEELERTLSFEEVYGKDLAALDADWRRFLEGVEVGLGEQARARESFDPDAAPPYLEQHCPKLGPREERLQDRARRLARMGDLVGALEAHLQLWERKGKLKFAIKAARLSERLGRHAETLAFLDTLPLADAPPDQVHQVLGARIEALRELRDWDGLYAALDARRALVGAGPEGPPDEEAADDGEDLGVAEQALRQESVRERVAQALHFGAASEGRQILRSLLAEHPDDPAIRLLAASRAFPLPDEPGTLLLSGEWMDRVDDAVSFVEATPEACDTLWRRLVGVVDLALDTGDLDLAERIAGVVSTRCTSPLAQHRAADRLARAAWERERRLKAP